MTDLVEPSKSATEIHANCPTGGPSNAESGNTTRAIVQLAGGLLSLPPEIRLHICSYITLSPVSRDSINNRNILGTCRQLQQDMLEEHGPAKDLDTYMKAPERPWIERPSTHSTVALGQPLPLTRFIRIVTLHTPSTNLNRPLNLRQLLALRQVDDKYKDNFEPILGHLYSLYLDRLHILFTDTSSEGKGRSSLREDRPSQSGDSSRQHEDEEEGNEDDEEYFDDTIFTVKSLHPNLFFDFVRAGTVNCRAVVFTVEKLSNAEDGRDRSTVLDMSEQDTGISYTMTIVQDKEERQVEREFISETRFRQGALQTRVG